MDECLRGKIREGADIHLGLVMPSGVKRSLSRLQNGLPGGRPIAEWHLVEVGLGKQLLGGECGISSGCKFKQGRTQLTPFGFDLLGVINEGAEEAIEFPNQAFG
jgi:hypothetical protein